jgi:hypothetical protein
MQKFIEHLESLAGIVIILGLYAFLIIVTG